MTLLLCSCCWVGASASVSGTVWLPPLAPPPPPPTSPAWPHAHAGACPKSYGTNVARLAGLPPAVVRRAAQKSAEREVNKLSQVCVCECVCDERGGGGGRERDRVCVCVCTQAGSAVQHDVV